MRSITIYLTLAVCLLATKLTAQETFEAKARAIAEKIEKITQEEKEALKIEVEEVNKQLENGSLTKAQADEKKQKLAEARATIIENKVAVAQAELKDLVQQKVDGKIKEVSKDRSYTIDLGWKSKNDSLKKANGEPRTTSQFVFAAGLNNLVTDGDVENSDFRFLGSHFYEWGVSYNTRIAKNSNLLHFKYGWSVMYNNLRPTDNRSFVVTGDQTNLETSPYNLDESRLRNVYLAIPMHLEFDFSGKKVKDDKTIFRSHQSFRFGFGGYGGIRLKTKEILKYEDENGDDIKQKTKKDFNASNFIYGVSAYIGYKETSLYVKYDLNPLFQNNPIKQNNVSLGVRFDLN
ncbi:OmpH family outer membrane protein [Flavobacterium sp.]|uniref:OmpH family outer membrane protein n=1 Tax=Flavobacterium sp. TaxID=239 RepID=UPI002B4B49B5|nr:OmpH family outer membrane protein [Flavobacterium sp.]HLP65695.1 OmpH family outer membrane protein [Flavobacterium sp.]